MHLKRFVTAAILLPLFYLYVMKLPQVYFLILLIAASVIAQAEFYSMYRVSGFMRMAGIVSGVLLLLTSYYNKDFFADMLLLSLLVVLTLRLFGRRDPSSSLHDVSPVILAVLYVPGLLGFQLSLRTEGPEWIVFLFGCVWASDSFAYYLGKSIGKRKLYESVSPNKTIAGAVGSLIGGALSGWLLNVALGNSISLQKAILTGTLIGTATIIGDLAESMFKRDAGVKDSSGLIPGHGGALDKLDGVLFAGPVLYWALRWM